MRRGEEEKILLTDCPSTEDGFDSKGWVVKVKKNRSFPP